MDGCLYEKSYSTILFCERKKDAGTIPGNVKQIGSYTFGDCNSLSEVIISLNDIIIPIDLFIGCKGLKTLRLPTSFVAFDHESGVLSRTSPATAYIVDLTKCDNLNDIFYDGTWEQWLQKPVCVYGTVTIYVQDGSVLNDRKREDFFSDLMAKLGWNQITDF